MTGSLIRGLNVGLGTQFYSNGKEPEVLYVNGNPSGVLVALFPQIGSQLVIDPINGNYYFSVSGTDGKNWHKLGSTV